MSWKDRATKEDSKKSSWKDRATVEVAQDRIPEIVTSKIPDDPSMIGTAARNFTQGGMAGWSDEGAGLLEAGGRIVGGKGFGGPIKDISFSLDNLPTKPGDLSGAYREGRDQEREKLKRDQEINPGTAGVSKFTGAVVSPVNKLIPSLGIVGGSAALGGLTSAGESEKENLGGLLTDTSKGAAIGAGTGAALQVAGKGLKAAANTSIGKSVINKVGKAAAKISSALTGVSEKEISTYAKHADEINRMTKAADNDSQLMADELRKKFNASISAKRQEVNAEISKTLAQKGGETLDHAPIIKQLEAAKSKINAKLYPEQVAQVDEIIGKVNSLAQDGKMGLQDAHDVKEFLQEVGKGAYKKGGEIFQVGKDVANAAKGGAAVARKSLDKVAPEITKANSVLQRLHEIDDVANGSLLHEGKAPSSLMAAGTGANTANAKVLKDLGAVTGTNMLGEAEKLAAARTFGKPSLLPVDATGKSLTRMGIAGGLGFMFGHVPGMIAAEGLASPAATKLAINAGRSLGKNANSIASNPTVQSLITRGLLPKPAQGLIEEAPVLSSEEKKKAKPQGKPK